MVVRAPDQPSKRLGEARANGNEILDAVCTSGDLSADTEAKLKAMLERYTQRFAA